MAVTLLSAGASSTNGATGASATVTGVTVRGSPGVRVKVTSRPSLGLLQVTVDPARLQPVPLTAVSAAPVTV